MARYRDFPLDCKVYVGNLGTGFVKRELQEAFGKFGQLRDVWVARNPPGFAFVQFEKPSDAEAAVQAMNETEFCGNRIRVDLSKNRPRRLPQRFKRSRSRSGDRGRYGRRRYRSRSRSRTPRRNYSRSSSRSPRRRNYNRSISRSPQRHSRRSPSSRGNSRSRSRSLGTIPRRSDKRTESRRIKRSPSSTSSSSSSSSSRSRSRSPPPKRQKKQNDKSPLKRPAEKSGKPQGKKFPEDFDVGNVPLEESTNTNLIQSEVP